MNADSMDVSSYVTDPSELEFAKVEWSEKLSARLYQLSDVPIIYRCSQKREFALRLSSEFSIKRRGKLESALRNITKYLSMCRYGNITVKNWDGRGIPIGRLDSVGSIGVRVVTEPRKTVSC